MDETDAMVGCPVDPLAQGEGVTDSEVALAAGREGGDQDTGKTFKGRVHAADVGSPWDSVNAELLGNAKPHVQGGAVTSRGGAVSPRAQANEMRKSEAG